MILISKLKSEVKMTSDDEEEEKYMETEEDMESFLKR
jgi:hypothetical protein